MLETLSQVYENFTNVYWLTVALGDSGATVHIRELVAAMPQPMIWA